uniref:Class I SAM-dependent methyltransferase n=1 Tax=Acidicaldus sp. TaxID=1872105 RepID=A0A8J4HBS7_9PROT
MMGFTAFRRLVERLSVHAAAAAPLTGARLAGPAEAAPGLAVAPQLALRHELCGEGFLLPGGEEEVLRLARPLGLSEATSLLLVGAGSGGPVAAVAATFGAWVAGYEADPDLRAIATVRCQHHELGKRASIAAWSAETPAFPVAHFHHALALLPLGGAPAAPVLTALARALRPRGQLVLLEFVAPAPLDPALARWAQLDGRSPAVPEAATITSLFEPLGLDLRVVEDHSERHITAILQAWRALIAPLAHARPNLERARLLVAEAERWLVRVRLMQEGKLQLMRWHALVAAPARQLDKPAAPARQA